MRFIRLFTSLSHQRDDFVCAVTASNFSTSATVTKRCLAALADTLKAERMTELSLFLGKCSVTTIECVCPCWLLLRWQFDLARCESKTL